MEKTWNIRSFVLSKLFGIILVSISLFLAASLISYSPSDPFYGNLNSDQEKINNVLGFYGSFISGTFYVFFSYPSLIFPLFFLVTGIKKIINIKTSLFIIHFVCFIVGTSLLSFLLSYFNYPGGVVGGVILDFYKFNLLDLLNNIYFVMIFLLVTIFIAFFSIAYGLTLKMRFVIKVFIFPLKFLNILLKFSKKLKPEKASKENKKRAGFKKFNIKKFTKKEPTFQKNSGSFFKNTRNEERDSFLDNKHEYILPAIDLLKSSDGKKLNFREVDHSNKENAKRLEEILREYGVMGKINRFKTGPVITLFEFVPAAGVKTSKVVSLSEDIARSMSSMSARISSQPGKSTIGIEIPNNNRQGVYLGDLLRNRIYSENESGLMLALGKTISGEEKFTDLEKMPHLLIAGTTGSGKSVGINSMILSLLFKFKPSQCKLILIDPKMLELSIYENIPHLLTPVVTDSKKAVSALKWIVHEMENRYRLMSIAGVKNIKSFNEKISKYLLTGKKLFREVQTGIDNDSRMPIIEKKEIPLEKMPFIVVVIDEMADLMMVAGKEVEQLIQRLAQMARASGIHLITATQRPSVDVITGTIKANFPSRISFRVASRFDSRTILNEMGAEQLLGSGDMLFLESGANLMRLHGGFVSEEEIEKVVKFIKSQSTEEKKVNITEELKNETSMDLNLTNLDKEVDELYPQALSIVLKNQKASTSFIQRHLQIGYNRAARIIERMEEEGIISEANHVGKRNVLKKE